MRTVKALVVLGVVVVGVSLWAWVSRQAPESPPAGTRDVAAAPAKAKTFQSGRRIILPNA